MAPRIARRPKGQPKQPPLRQPQRPRQRRCWQMVWSRPEPWRVGEADGGMRVTAVEHESGNMSKLKVRRLDMSEKRKKIDMNRARTKPRQNAHSWRHREFCTHWTIVAGSLWLVTPRGPYGFYLSCWWNPLKALGWCQISQKLFAGPVFWCKKWQYLQSDYIQSVTIPYHLMRHGHQSSI